VDEKLFLKGYRRVREGLNPELEMGRFLTEAVHYPNCVPVLGAMEYFGQDGRIMTLALVQAYVSNQGDGWDYAFGYLERHLEALSTSGGEAPPSTVHGGFLELAATLGQRAAELHLALATPAGNPAFDAEVLTSADRAQLRSHVAAEAMASMDLLRERLEQLPAPVQDVAQAVLRRKVALR
jgi:maltose alpha-D-glucosyltransferase/alpha-amylase